MFLAHKFAGVRAPDRETMSASMLRPSAERPYSKARTAVGQALCISWHRRLTSSRRPVSLKRRELGKGLKRFVRQGMLQL